VRNPATGEVIGSLPDMGHEETEQAVQAAYKAFYSWRNTTAKVIENMGDIIMSLIWHGSNAQ